MRELVYDSPIPVKNTSIHEGKVLQNPSPEYYNRFSTVGTKRGFVTVIDFDWQTNNGKCFWTEFSIIKGGIMYRATLKEGNLSDRQIKWLATHFANNIYKKQE